MEELYITTVDNPYNPRYEEEAWLQYDVKNGYNTLAYIARVAGFDVDDTEFEMRTKREQALYDILRSDVLGIYKTI